MSNQKEANFMDGPSNITKQKVIDALMKDPLLAKDQKEILLSKIQEDPSFLTSFMTGAAGAGAGYILAKYFNLGGMAQMLMSAAGFGIGQLLWNYANKKTIAASKGLEWDEKAKIYRIL